MPISLTRSLRWFAAILLGAVAMAALWIAVFGWNWLRAPLERMVTERTGRALVIQGDLQLHLGWPLPRLRLQQVRFANPAWAVEREMLAADAVDIRVDLPELLRRRIVLREVRLERAVVFLEQEGADGRRTWRLDLAQQDETAAIQVDRLTIDHGTLGFDDVPRKTRIRSEVSTAADAQGAGVSFDARGQYLGLPMQARGSGGPVLSLRDETTPYPLKIDGSVGRTRVQAEGSITNLTQFTALDMRMDLRGDNLEQLFPLLGIALPATRAYTTSGHLRRTGQRWDYEGFAGRIGDSDVAGSLQVQTGGTRPVLTAKLVSKVLDIADLGPLIGARPGKLQAARQAAPPAQASVVVTPARARVLPDLPFKTDRWDTLDADVTLRVGTIRRAKELPLEDLSARLRLADSVLTLDPLEFGLAGGTLNAVIVLDGRKHPIQAQARVRARKVLLSKLFPTIDLNRNTIGQINGEFDLRGQGDSVGTMLAGADGKLALVVAGGEVSRLMMEKAGLHLWEILQLNLSGDQRIRLRCAVAEFDVRKGIMRAEALVFDTAVTTISGKGTINLANETLDLKLNQNTKNTSPLALRSPIYLRGSFARPEVGVDKTRMAARALGAVALGLVNPLLALVPLIDAGPGADSDCGQLVREARAAAPAARSGAAPAPSAGAQSPGPMPPAAAKAAPAPVAPPRAAGPPSTDNRR